MTAHTTTLAGFSATAGDRGIEAGAALVRGDRLDRYVILGCLGIGGMGVVYAAYDPDLDRKVAVKLLRFAAPDGRAWRRRLLGEAQALARLAHPNVVAVFDTGEVGDQVFITMEFVAGRDLGEWCRDQGRSWRDVLDTYRQAGRGLAAAHDAGLVHRDFKPNNVLVGDDGRVRVLDFGLAQPAAETADRGQDPVDPTARFGTPSYMAPEQADRGTADARSDQYSFCCALYHGLYGQAPFAADGVAELTAAKRRGEVREPPAAAGVPAWLTGVLKRGLEPDPASRHPSMHDLLEELARDPSRRRRRISAAIAILALMLVLALGWQRSAARRADLCRDAASHWAGIWDEQSRQAVGEAFMATGVAYAEPAFRHLARSLDAYASDWTAMRTEACEATHLRGEQSTELLDLRMGCLDQRLQGASAMTDLMRQADAAIVGRAANLTSSLRPLAVCADAARLKAVIQPPEDAAVAERVAEVHQLLARAWSSQLAGRAAAGLELARQAVAAAEPLDYPPVLAEAQHRLGYSELILGDFEAADAALRAGWQQAEAGRHAEIEFLSLLHLAWSTISQRQGFAAGKQHLDIADGVLRGLGDPVELRHQWHYTAAYVHQAAGRYPRAADHARQAVAGARKFFGNDHYTLASYLTLLGSVLLAQGQTEAALEQLLEAERIKRLALGEEHPSMGDSYQALGRTYLELGRLVDAAAELERARGLVAKAYGAESQQAVTVIHDLGAIDIKLGRYRQALERHRQALAIRRRLQDPYEAARSLNMIGQALTRSGQTAAAEEALTEALGIVEATRAAGDPVLAYYLANLAELRTATGRHARAASLLRRAEALDLGAGARAEIDVRRGLNDLATGDLANARKSLERALHSIGPGDLLDRADVRFALARILARQRLDGARVRALAQEAAEGYLQLADGREKAMKVRAWLERWQIEADSEVGG